MNEFLSFIFANFVQRKSNGSFNDLTKKKIKFTVAGNVNTRNININSVQSSLCG